MKYLSLVLARKNSTRLKNKNLKKIGGNTLVDITIQKIKSAKINGDILLSTDSQQIYNRAKKFKILTPWLRPKSLSQNTSSSSSVCLHALKWYEKNVTSCDAIILFQPTTPFRKVATIKKAIKLYEKHKTSLVSFTDFTNKKNFLYTFKKSNLKNINFNLLKNNLLLSNGYIYIVNKDLFLKQKKFYYKNSIPFLIDDPVEAIDIDYNIDLKIAKFFFKNNTHLLKMRTN